MIEVTVWNRGGIVDRYELRDLREWQLHKSRVGWSTDMETDRFMVCTRSDVFDRADDIAFVYDTNS